jgi:O-antigen/teichoic acid export membrane protein
MQVEVNTIKKSLFQNTTIASVEKIFSLAVSILTLPLIVSKFGNHNYGRWVFLLSVTNYFLLAQFGVSVSFKKYIAEDLAFKRYESVKEFYTTAFYTLLAISAILIVGSALFGPYIFRFFNIGDTIKSNTNALIFLVTTSCVALVNEIAVSIPQCYQRFDIASYISIAGKIVFVLIIYIYFSIHPTINTMIMAIFISNSSILLLNIFYGYKLFPSLNFSFKYIKKFQLIRMIKFGMKIQVAFFANYVANNLDKLLIGKYLGSASIAIYDIGTKIISFLREIPYVFFLIIMPYSSELLASNDLNAVKKIGTDFTKYFLIFSSIIFSLIAITGESLLKFWIGNSLNPVSVYVLHVLLVGATVHLSTGILTSILKSAGKIRPEIIGNAAIMVINCILSVTFIKIWGIKGVVWGTSIGFIFGSIVLFYLGTKALNISFAEFMFEIFFVPTVNVVVIVGTSLILKKVLYSIEIANAEQLAVHFLIGCFLFIVDVLILIKIKLLPSIEFQKKKI